MSFQRFKPVPPEWQRDQEVAMAEGADRQREADAALVKENESWIAQHLRGSWNSKTDDLLASEIVEHLVGLIRGQA